MMSGITSGSAEPRAATKMSVSRARGFIVPTGPKK